jgi:hypothetical protein
MTSAGTRLPLAGPAPRHAGSALRSRLLPIGFGQLLAWEAALAVIPLTAQSVGRPEHVVIAALAILVIATTSVRFGGRHLLSWTLTWISYRLLQHDDRLRTADPLRVLAHDFRLRQHIDRAGNRFGIAGAGDGWTAVIRVDGEPPVGTLLDALWTAFAGTEIPLAGAGLSIRSDADGRVYLLAVRYRPSQAPFAALLRGQGEDGELRAVARAGLALVAALAKQGHHGTLLVVGELAAELRAALGEHDPKATVTEGWRWWSAGGTKQACFTPRRSIDPEIALLARSPTAAATVTSYTLWRTESGAVRDEVTIRLINDVQRPPRARDAGLPVFPLYGRQAAGMRRTLPLALPR